jgi:hypothetical protein
MLFFSVVPLPPGKNPFAVQIIIYETDCLCGLVVSVPGYRSRGLRFDSPALPDFLRSSGSGTGST